MKVSVITPSFNQLSFLKKTVQCILQQEVDAIHEYIIVDPGSTDGSREYLATLDHPKLQLILEKDAGQSDGINKGLSQATGEIVTWLNSDDVYKPGALTKVIEAFENSPEAQWVIGHCDIIDENDQEIRAWVSRYKRKRLNQYAYRKLLRENFISQMGVFWRREFGEKIGLLDKSLNYTMDYDLWLRMGAEYDPLILDTVTSSFRLYNTSKTGRRDSRQFWEQYEVACRYFGDDKTSRRIHRFNVFKILWAYRLLAFFRL